MWKDRNVSSNLMEGNEMNAQKTLSTSGTVIITGNMTFKAGNAIILNPGFHAQAGSIFSAILQTCAPSTGTLQNEVDAGSSKRIIGYSTQNTPEVNISLTVMPNPFRGETVIQYNLNQTAPILIQVMDVNGRVVKILENRTTKAAGINEVRFSGDGLDAGMYYVFLVTPTKVLSKKIVLMR